jgi:hypothetical protein
MRSIRILVLVAVSAVAWNGCSSTSNLANGGGSGGGSGSGGQAGSGPGGQAGGGAGGHAGGAAGAGGQAGGGAGGHAGAQGGASGTDCSPHCDTSSVCVGTGTQGGAVIQPDAGVCPPGRHVQNNLCVQDLAYQCSPIPSACNGTVTCSCAATSLCSGRTCLSASPTEVLCVLQVP